jgi:hypothetical protein
VNKQQQHYYDNESQIRMKNVVLAALAQLMLLLLFFLLHRPPDARAHSGCLQVQMSYWREMEWASDRNETGGRRNILNFISFATEKFNFHYKSALIIRATSFA